jgi:hypothetical protein
MYITRPSPSYKTVTVTSSLLCSDVGYEKGDTILEFSGFLCYYLNNYLDVVAWEFAHLRRITQGW